MQSNFDGVLILRGGKHDRLHEQLKQARPRVVVFDFVRETEDRVPYGVIESSKDGYVGLGMYGSLPARFPKPHVICFSNFIPDSSKLSNDRWDIINLD